MRLELGTFPVHEARFGARTRWSDRMLEIDRDAVLEIARSDPYIGFADVDIARPGESVRIVNVSDVVEPRIKVDGPGVCYPGSCGRPNTTVGRGRTHRLGGFAVVESVPSRVARPATASGGKGGWAARQDFIDMSGPGAVRPFAQFINLVLTLDPAAGLDAQDRCLATHTAALRIADHLAEAVRGLDAPEREVFDLSARDPALAGIVYIPVLASFEVYSGGPDSQIADAPQLQGDLAVAVYGMARLSAPWVLHPTELMDGAVSQGTSWELINNPLVMELARRHGKDLNFLAVIVHRSNWGGQPEMELAAARDAQAAVLLGAQAAIVTIDIRGRRFVDAVAAIKACEAEGIRTVFLTEEEDDEDGTAPPLLINDPATVAVVSTGTGAVPGPFPPVERLLGTRQPDPEWLGERPAIAGRYGAGHLRDRYGYGRQSCASY